MNFYFLKIVVTKIIPLRYVSNRPEVSQYDERHSSMLYQPFKTLSGNNHLCQRTPLNQQALCFIRAVSPRVLFFIDLSIKFIQQNRKLANDTNLTCEMTTSQYYDNRWIGAGRQIGKVIGLGLRYTQQDYKSSNKMQ